MNPRHHIVFFRPTLLLLALLAPVSLAQAPQDGAFLPEGIEATGDTSEVRVLHAWVEEHRFSHPRQAEQAARRALALARELDDQHRVGESLMVLGDLVFMSDLEQGEAYYREAQSIFQQIGDESGVFWAWLSIGIRYHRAGEGLDRVLNAYSQGLEGFERIGDLGGQAAALNNIGAVYKEQGNLEEALTYFERAVALLEQLDRPGELGSQLNNFGATLAENGAYERAEMALRRALAISQEQGSKTQEVIASNNLGFSLNQQGRHRQALSFLLTAERLSKELGEDAFLTAVYDELGKANMGLAQYDEALRYANESLILAREMGSASREMEAHQTLSKIYEAAGDPVQALAHHRQYAAVRDSVFTTEKAEIVTEMQTRYETEEKQRANERLEQENRIQALQLTLLLGGVGALLLVLGVLFYRYRLKQRANRLLEELDKGKSRFFANISHEFRTPLTVILGGSQDILSGRLGNVSEKISAQLQVMLRNSRRLQRLIDEVLDLNRLEAGKLELKPAPGDLIRSLRRIVEADAPLADRNGIDLAFEHDLESCPRLYDEEKLEKIVGNLLSNALKFTPEGGSVRVVLRSKERTEIAVSDTGPGIPVEMQGEIFERFTQVEDGALHGGTGIGLALAKELAELHGGTITLESEPGKGSTFTVRLPFEKIDSDDIGTMARLRSRTRGGAMSLQQKTESVLPEEFTVGGEGHEERQDGEVPPSGGMVTQQIEETDDNPDRTTVLIIEDNADVRAFVRRSLEETYRVLEAADGETGLQQARSGLPDLIVSDIMLPGIDGYEIARRLKAEPATECIPVVMLTARAAEEDQTEGYGSGAEVYIIKPFSPETLRAACARLLEERRRLRRRLQDEAADLRAEEQENGEPTLRERARVVVLERLHDEDFGVEELASALGMSLRTLQRHVKSEMGLSPSDFVRTLRLEQARELLTDGAGSVSEVAYAVGFNSLVAFSRTYSAHYGDPPSAHLGREKKISG